MTRLTRDWPRTAALVGVTLIGLYLCARLAEPFLPGLVWAVALAVVGIPMHRRIAKVVKNPNWAAGLSTAAVVMVIGFPTLLVATQLVNESARAADVVREHLAEGEWKRSAAQVPLVGQELAATDPAEIEVQLRQFTQQIAARSAGVAGGVLGGFLQALIAVFVLFFCFRDRHHLLAEVRKLIPLKSEAADQVIGQAADAVHATVYGTLLTAVLQAVSGGLLFWAIGLPSPILWGAVMFVLGVLPFVGAVLVWLPAAVFLVSRDRLGEAAILVVWGLVMAGPVCNWVYSCAVGNRMRIHAVPTLVAYVGGLAVFGISGMVIGPCILAVTLALLSIWRHRTESGVPVAASVDRPVTRSEIIAGSGRNEPSSDFAPT